MKYLKTYENRKEIYYIIHIDGNWEKFLMALEKLNITEHFFGDWNIREFDDLTWENKEFFDSDTIVLLHSDDYFVIRYDIKEIEREFTKSAKFGGEIYISDEELAAKKYNL